MPSASRWFSIRLGYAGRAKVKSKPQKGLRASSTPSEIRRGGGLSWFDGKVGQPPYSLDEMMKVV